MGMTVGDIRSILEREKCSGFVDLYENHGIGSQCASCEFEVKGIVDDYRAELGIRTEIAERGPLRQQHKRRSLWRGLKKLLPIAKSFSRGGLFALRTPDLESKVVVSNLNFPEGNFRPNGNSITFTISVVNEHGEKVGSRGFRLDANKSQQYALSSIVRDCPESFVGAFYIDFHDLDMTAALRPYAVLDKRNPKSEVAARCHYHDKYATFIDPGFFQTAWPFHQGLDCWLAVSNCQDAPYFAEAVLKGLHRTVKADFFLPPLCSKWTRIEDIFGSVKVGCKGDFEPGLFYLNSPQHVMVWFFWNHTRANTWVGNHH
jgi:hypothetical protein